MGYSLLELKNTRDARIIRQSDIGDRIITINEFVHVANLFKAFWQSLLDPSPGIPHAILRSGEHSNGYIDCMEFLQWSNLCEIFAYQLAMIIRRHYSNPIGTIVDAAYSGTDLGHEVARILSESQYLAVAHKTVQKDEQGNPTKWRGKIAAGALVGVVNDVLSTAAGSTYMAKQAVKAIGTLTEDGVRVEILFLPFVTVLVNRSYEVGDLPDGDLVLCLARFQWRTFKVDEGETCPYCAVGSKAYRPKEDDNWLKHFSH